MVIVVFCQKSAGQSNYGVLVGFTFDLEFVLVFAVLMDLVINLAIRFVRILDYLFFCVSIIFKLLRMRVLSTLGSLDYLAKPLEGLVEIS